MERFMMFVIQSYPRSGTHLLKTALDSHSKIKCYGELCNPDFHDHLESTEQILNLLRRSTLQAGFLAHATIGTKHQTDERRKKHVGLWKNLQQAKKKEPIIILNIFRQNLFERFISERIAIMTNRWNCRNEHDIVRVAPWRVDPQKAIQDFRRTLDIRNEARKRFPQAQWFAYEDLVNSKAKTLAIIQKTLQVSIEKLKPKTIKVGRKMRDTIKNYDELKSHFSNTRFARFFQE